MPSISSRHLFAAGLLGATSGMRTFTPPAALATRCNLANIVAGPANLALSLVAAGELVGDKLPNTPSRTMPAAVLGRMASGGICGLVVAGPLGAVLASATSVATTFLAHDARAAAVRRTRLPDLPFALLEDAITISVAAAAVRLSRPTP